MSIDILKERIKKKEYPGVYFFYGQEEYTKDRYADLLRKCMSGCPLPEFDHVIIDASTATCDDFENAVYSLPSMWDIKMVELRGIDLNVLKKDKLEGFSRCLDDMPDGCVLLYFFRAGELDDETAEGRKKTKSGAEAQSPAVSFINKLRENALCVNFTRESGDRLYAWIRKHFLSRKVEIDHNAVYTLVDMCGNDMYTLFGEIEKLTMFYGGRSITRDDVRQICCPNESYRAYELSNAVMKRDLYTAKKIFDSLKRNRTEPSVILAQISRAYSDALMVNVGLSERRSFAEIAAAAKLPQNRISAIAASSRGRSIGAMCNAVKLCDDTDRLIKSSREDAYLAVEMLIARICAYGE